MDRHDALQMLRNAGVDPEANFFSLRQEQVSGLMQQADRAKYRQPKNANGSRARYFHARLLRAIARDKD